MTENLHGWKCGACGLVSFGDGGDCMHCGSADTVRYAASGAGELVSWSVVRVAPERFAGEVPYAIGLVQLADCTRLLGRLQTVPGEDEGLGTPVSFLRIEEHGSILFATS